MFASSSLVGYFSLGVCLPEETKAMQSFASFILIASSAYILLSHNGAHVTGLRSPPLFTYLFIYLLVYFLI